MPQKTNPKSRLADAALRILAKKAWRDIALADVARAAKVPMSEIAAYAPAKQALLTLILGRFGETVAKTYKPDRDAASGRDRLFDIGMAWFDAMAPHRAAIHALYNGFRSDPLTLLSARGDVVAAAEWLMTLAEADKGPALSLRAVGFAAILGRAIPVWLDDDHDLTKTMARLDGDLNRGERWFGKL